MDILAHQFFEIQSGLRVTDRITGLQRIATPAGRKREKLFSDNAPRFDRRDRVAIQLDAVVHGEDHGRTILLEGDPAYSSNFDSGNFDRRPGFQPGRRIELRDHFVDITADEFQLPQLDREVPETENTHQHEQAHHEFNLHFFHRSLLHPKPADAPDSTTGPPTEINP